MELKHSKRLGLALLAGAFLAALAMAFGPVQPPSAKTPNAITALNNAVSGRRSSVIAPAARKFTKEEKAKMPTYNAAGAGRTDVDGDYPPTGTLNGATLYKVDADNWLAWSISLNRWAFGNIDGFSGPAGFQAANQFYYSTDGDINNVPLTGWTALVGASPPPTVTIGGAASGAKKSSYMRRR